MPPTGRLVRFQHGDLLLHVLVPQQAHGIPRRQGENPFRLEIPLEIRTNFGSFETGFCGQTLNFLTFEVVLNREIDPAALKKFLATRQLEVRFNSF